MARLRTARFPSSIERPVPAGLIKTHITGTIKDDTLEMKSDAERNGKLGVLER